MSIVELVNLGKSALGVAGACRLLGISRSSYYSQSNAKPKKTRRCRALTAQVVAVFDEHKGRYGAPRIFRALRGGGLRVSRKTVAAVMRENGRVARPRKRFKPMTTDSNHSGPIAPNLLEQNFTTEQPNHTWVGDITCVKISDRWMYLAVFIDLFSRRVVGWATSVTPNAALVLRALDSAAALREPPPGLVVHTDRGTQYASAAFRHRLAKLGAKPSMSRKGNCYDNAVAESFFATLEFELRSHRQFYAKRDADLALGDYIDNYYNRKRMHSTLDYLSPVEYEVSKQASAGACA